MQQLLICSQKDQQSELKALLLKYYQERWQEGGSLEELDKFTTLLPQDDEGTLLNRIDQRLLLNIRSLVEE